MVKPRRTNAEREEDRKKDELRGNLDECVSYIRDITEYPPEVIRDILSGFKMYATHSVQTQVLRSDEFEDAVDFYIPLVGKVTLESLTDSREGQLMYSFKPTDNFHKDIVKSYYEGESSFERMIKSKMMSSMVTEYRDMLEEEYGKEFRHTYG